MKKYKSIVLFSVFSVFFSLNFYAQEHKFLFENECWLYSHIDRLNYFLTPIKCSEFKNKRVYSFDRNGTFFVSAPHQFIFKINVKYYGTWSYYLSEKQLKLVFNKSTKGYKMFWKINKISNDSLKITRTIVR